MIAIIDVSGSNLTSLTNAICRLGYEYKLTHDPATIIKASHVILPGVGAAASGMQALIEHNLVATLKQVTQPLLGICLGMQLLLEHSEEGNVNCLGLIPGVARRLPVLENHPVPHMGWNKLTWQKQSPLRSGLNDDAYVYFVHSYALFNEATGNAELASCQYSQKFSAVLQQGNIYGMQFHPEKSAEVGLTLLNNFLTWKKQKVV